MRFHALTSVVTSLPRKSPGRGLSEHTSVHWFGRTRSSVGLVCLNRAAPRKHRKHDSLTLLSLLPPVPDLPGDHWDSDCKVPVIANNDRVSAAKRRSSIACPELRQAIKRLTSRPTLVNLFTKVINSGRSTFPSTFLKVPLHDVTSHSVLVFCDCDVCFCVR